MTRRLAPAIVLLAALAPAVAHAQTDIDQGKTPAQIFASDCAACHKAMRGLANGRNRTALAGFLAEHYTASRDQAAALAAYVLAGGGGDTRTAAQGREQKPGPEHAIAPVEEPKPATRQGRRPPKPEGEAASAKPEEKPGAADESGSSRRRAAARREVGSAPGTGSRPKPAEPLPAAAEPAAVVATPSSPETATQDAGAIASPGPSAAAPADASPGEAPPVPRDDIPD